VYGESEFLRDPLPIDLRVANPGEGGGVAAAPTRWSALGSHRAGRLPHHPGHQRRVA
jgi:hypothetical protein